MFESITTQKSTGKSPCVYFPGAYYVRSWPQAAVFLEYCAVRKLFYFDVNSMNGSLV